MNSKLIGIIVLVLVIGAGVFFSQKENKTASKPVAMAPTKSEASEEAVVKGAKTKQYSLDEVAKHNSPSDCWMAIEGKVYNTTDFVEKHPGGPAIVNGCGKDATTLFNERPTHNKGPHPKSAQEMLEKMYIGDLKK